MNGFGLVCLALPADLAVPSSIPGDNRKRDSIAHSLSLSPSHRPDMTEILLKGLKIANHAFILPTILLHTVKHTKTWDRSGRYKQCRPTLDCS